MTVYGPAPVLAVGSMILGAWALGFGVSAPAFGQISPEASAKKLKPADGLEAALWASEPMVNNPTNMDIDARGRVWITEGLNYRLSRGANKRFTRVDDSDKVKILEDTDGDGKADKVTVFADKIFPVPMGLAVEETYGPDGKYKGCKVYVGNSPDLLVLEDTDGDDKADKRYPLLTGFGGVDSDHGVHGMVLGLDGKLYFTHGRRRLLFGPAGPLGARPELRRARQGRPARPVRPAREHLAGEPRRHPVRGPLATDSGTTTRPAATPSATSSPATTTTTATEAAA